MAKKPDLPFPKEFLCPISWDIMTDPVTCGDGIVYNRSNIAKWLEEHDTSPVTNERLRSKELIPNEELKRSIEAMCKTTGNCELFAKNLGEVKATLGIEALVAAERAQARAEAEAECSARFQEELARVCRVAQLEKAAAVEKASKDAARREKKLMMQKSADRTPDTNTTS